jgi:predicted transcriptional regulator
MTRREQVMQLREQNKTYQEIGDELGISRQRVGAYLKTANPRGYKAWVKGRCVYTGLREWLIDNKCTMRQFIIQLGYTYHTNNAARWRNLLNGNTRLNIEEIRSIIWLTGKTFEELFVEDKDGADNA